jgi:predicted nuclease with TOPRIM domain
LVRGKTEEGIKNTKAILEEDVTIVHKMHADAAKLTELKAEYADLEWAFKKQQDENRIFTQQLNTLKKEMEKTEKAAEFGALFKVAERERDMALQVLRCDIVDLL